MKIISGFLTSLILIFFVTSCQQDEVEFIDILTLLVPIEIPAGLNSIETHYFEYLDEPTRIGAILQSNNISKEEISFIRPRSATLRSLATGESFDFLQQSFIEIASRSEDFIECYFVDRIPNNEDAILDLIPNEVNMKSRLIQDFVDIRLALLLKRPNPATFRAEMEMTFFVQR